MEQEKANAIRAQLHEALDMVLDINGAESRRKELTGEKPTAFFSFSGHVNAVRVDAIKDGYIQDYKCTKFIEAWLDDGLIPEEQMEALRAYHKEVCHES